MAKQSSTLANYRAQISQAKHTEEHAFVAGLLQATPLTPQQRRATEKSARSLVSACRKDTRSKTLLDSFLQEFGLSNKEGIALMCLAEALLRVPDKTTADRLIAEKIATGNWQSHSGNSDSVFVNSATWGMILTGKLIRLDDEITQQTSSWLNKLSSKLSEPIVRRAILQAMRIMGGQYVLGRSIDEGIGKSTSSNSNGTLYSFDMLGEAARTESDAENYYLAYANALDKVGQLNHQSDVYAANGISVKLSALHPRYEFSQAQTVKDELLPKITALCLKAKQYNIGLSIDAEEAARLELSLDLFECLCRNPELKGWDGLGFVLQAYQKRAPAVASWLVELAKETGRKLMVRLVKGAYWDAEIKHAQEQGLTDYPVFTRKVNTDVCYLHCAKLLLASPEGVFAQFATHNAYTAMALINIANSQSNAKYEFQRLHGMGELLYKHLPQTSGRKHLPIRVYAPVGEHEDLLPYLVRRLLENGANSSFVNRFLDNHTPVDELIQDIYTQAKSHKQLRHLQIPLPVDLYNVVGEPRNNSKGLDLDDANTVEEIERTFHTVADKTLRAHSIIGGRSVCGKPVAITNPANCEQTVGNSSYATADMVESALAQADAYRPIWQSTPVNERAAILNRMGDALETNMLELMAIINLEAGRTIADCVSEVREAVDFCRYYALQATAQSTGQGAAQSRGVFFCISPWNFPLAIFVGQISAALVAGNCVIAKPAEQTPLVAARAVELCLAAGCPSEALHLVLGVGADIGKLVSRDQRINGIAFTGSTETARHINQQIAQRDGETIPLIAETGGQNCMIVDSTALPEQVIDDVISSAFHSAGQRCSALRVLYIQDVIADKAIDMLLGAMRAVNVNTPGLLSTDVGPVIDQQARQGLLNHQSYIEPICKFSAKIEIDADLLDSGTYFAPSIYEIDSLSDLKREVFGPVLHVIRFDIKQLDSVIEEINNSGYGLTLGVHSRIEAFAEYVFRNTNVGNTYINRNTIGAVVGVNPFGGKGLSGTGPKAGGPNYLHRFQRQTDNNIDTAKTSEVETRTKFNANKAANSTQVIAPTGTEARAWSGLSTGQRCQALLDNIKSDNHELQNSLVTIIETIVRQHADTVALPGPTGEENTLLISSRGLVMVCVDEQVSATDLTHLLALILSVGNSILLHCETPESQAIANTAYQVLGSHLPAGTLTLGLDELSIDTLNNPAIAMVVVATQNPAKLAIRQTLAQRAGPITPVIEFDSSIRNPMRCDNYLSFFIDERTKTENLVARGGNTQLFNLQE